ncbi:MAG: helix-turn-helix domain-containing protein [Candidatus Lokiarchaeota archaeon]|nr:helix-turn-helix domain-containing protein [Candidatus Lokiarchaeota archaeon]
MVLNLQQEIEFIEQSFHKAGFDTINCGHENKSCSFNILAFRPEKFVITKVTDNIDSIPNDYLLEMSLIAHLINGLPLLVGHSNRRSHLQDNAIYMRFHSQIIALNFTTLNKILTNNILPYKLARRGQFIVKIDGSKMRNKREDMSLSRKELSQMLDLSKKSIAEYERGNMNANVNNLKKIEQKLSIRVRLPLDIFNHKIKYEKINNLLNNKPDNKKPYIADEISEILEEIGLNQFWTKKSPFDVLINIPVSSESKNGWLFPIISSIFPSEEQEVIARIKLLSRMLSFLKINGTVIVEGKSNAKKCQKAGVPTIEHKELKEVKNPKEFKKLVQKKM